MNDRTPGFFLNVKSIADSKSSTPIYKMGVSFDALVNGRFGDGIGPVAVVQAVGCPVEMLHLVFLSEEDFKLLGLLHLNRVKPNSPNLDSLLQGAVHNVHRLRQAVLQHVIIQIGKTGRVERK